MFRDLFLHHLPLSINQTWSIDFMSDSLKTGRKIRTFNMINDYNRKYLGIEVDHSLPTQRVIQSLEQLIEWRDKPKAIRCDNGPEYILIHLENGRKQWI